MSNKNEITLFARGGLGNQLFQFGAALNLSTKLDLPLVVDDLLLSKSTKNKNVGYRILELDSFESKATFVFNDASIKNRIKSKALSRQRIIGDRFPELLVKFGYFANEYKDFYDLFDSINKPITINSYCSRPLYFGAEVGNLVQNITSIKNPSDWFTRHKKLVSDSEPVGIHVRLGDYKKFASIYGQPDISYYINAINLLRELDGTRPIWLFSDEPLDAIELFGEKVEFDQIINSPKSSRPIETLVLLGSCKNLICANSSFSWWAGYISTVLDKKSNVIFPRPMFNDPNMVEPFNWLPKSWITLGRAI
jgi:hypothetical protein